MILRNKVIIIPAFNEEKNIEKCISNFIKIADIIVIDDGSNDKTKVIAERNNAYVLSHYKNLGYDKAITSGFIEAIKFNYQYIVTADADGQHQNKDIENCFNLLEKRNVKLVLGKRDRVNRFSEKILNYFSNKFLGIEDILCGLKGYDINILLKYNIKNNFNFVGTFVTIKAVKDNVLFKYIPVKIGKRIDSPRFGNIFSANFKIIKLILTIFIFHSYRT